MVRKSALVVGFVLAAWFMLDVTNAEACGCGRRCGSGCGNGYGGGCGYGGGYGYSGGCGYSGYSRGCGYGGGCGGCGGGYCGGYGRGYGYGYGYGPYGSSYNGGYATPIYGSGCSTCSTGYTVPGAYGYAVRMAPNYGPSFVLSRAGVSTSSNLIGARSTSSAVPVTAYRTNTVLRTSNATPSYATPVR